MRQSGHGRTWTARPPRPSRAARRNRLGALVASAREIVNEPFRVDPETLLIGGPGAAERRERARQRALLRLIVYCLNVVQIFISIPSTISAGETVFAAIPSALDVLLGVVCLRLNARGRVTLASALYVYGSICLLFLGAVSIRGGLSEKSMLLYGLFPIFLVIAGLLLPRWVIWPTFALLMGLLALGLLITPVAPGLLIDAANPPQARGVAGGLLGSTYLNIALLTWIFARGTRAGRETVTRAFQREQELARLKDQFIVDANHELRTPIMAWYGNTEFLQLLGDSATPEQREQLLGRALNAGDTVLRLLNSVLDASALEQHPPDLTREPVALAALVRATLETFDPREIGELGAPSELASPRPVTVHIPPDLMALADEGRLRQVLLNLLANALKYSPAGSPIEVTAALAASPERPAATPVERAAPAGEWVRVAVSDKGLGVPPPDQAKLFQRFVRLERDIAGPVRGTGVGLYLCRTLVEAMGGRIWVESSGVEGEGSTFAFTLPLAFAPIPAARGG